MSPIHIVTIIITLFSSVAFAEPNNIIKLKPASFGNKKIHRPNITTDGTVTDIDGNTYRAVRIGKQLWMAENLRTSKYANGTRIPEKPSSANWNLLENTNNREDRAVSNTDAPKQDGALYTYAAATRSTPAQGETFTQGVCPTNWHLPSDSEWQNLEVFLGMSEYTANSSGNRGTTEGRKLLKTTTNQHPIARLLLGKTNFKATLSGYRAEQGLFFDKGEAGYWWTASEHNEHEEMAYFRRLQLDKPTVYRAHAKKSNGYSVRCVRNEPLPPTLETLPVTARNTTATSARVNGKILTSSNAPVSFRGFEYSTRKNFQNGSGTTVRTTVNALYPYIFSATLANLQPDTIYYLRALARNSAGLSLGEEVTIRSRPEPVTDVDGNTYKTIRIGEQIWMAENLKVTQTNDRQPLVYTDNLEDFLQRKNVKATERKPQFAYPDFNIENKDTYGPLYSQTQDMCPSGWKLPLDKDWKELEAQIGMNPQVIEINNDRDRGTDVKATCLNCSATYQAGRTPCRPIVERGSNEATHLKTDRPGYWETTNTNNSGFSMLPVGVITKDGYRSNITTYWESTGREFVQDKNNIRRYKTQGLRCIAKPIRCIKIED